MQYVKVRFKKLRLFSLPEEQMQTKTCKTIFNLFIDQYNGR
jgi:hypothetical protein